MRNGIKKRKPRPSSIVSAANSRLRGAPSLALHEAAQPSSPPQSPVPSPPNVHSPQRLQKQEHKPKLQTFQQHRQKHEQQKAAAAAAKRKGLRHFAVRVCRKVEEKGVTTYNEVADELVAEERALRHGRPGCTRPEDLAALPPLVDEKNIRRRVYDSLNVLMAMEIIAKDKKLISWRGLEAARSSPHTERLARLREEMQAAQERVRAKRANLAEVSECLERMTALVNKRKEEARIMGEMMGNGPGDLLMPEAHEWFPPGDAIRVADGSSNIAAASAASLPPGGEQRLEFPFMIIRVTKETNIHLIMDDTREDVTFVFDTRFALMDDREIVKKLPLLSQPELSNHDFT